MVKPIMRARRWKVMELAEFYPDEPNLLGEKLYMFDARLPVLTLHRPKC